MQVPTIPTSLRDVIKSGIAEVICIYETPRPGCAKSNQTVIIVCDRNGGNQTFYFAQRNFA